MVILNHWQMVLRIAIYFTERAIKTETFIKTSSLRWSCWVMIIYEQKVKNWRTSEPYAFSVLLRAIPRNARLLWLGSGVVLPWGASWWKHSIRNRERESAILLSIPGTCTARKQKLYCKVQSNGSLTKSITRDALDRRELMTSITPPSPPPSWLSQWNWMRRLRCLKEDPTNAMQH